MRKIVDLIDLVLDKLLLAFFVVMTAAIVWQVFARYVLAAPTIWSEELARFLLVWITMLGSASVIGRGDHIAVTVFVEMTPAPVQRALGFLRDALVIGMAGFLAYYGAGFAASGSRRISTGLHLSMGYVYLAIPVGAVLIALTLLFRHRDR